MNINFELYKVFYEVANSKSISKGAEKLMISQPAVSQSIQTLENELGGKLFIRTPKGVILTNEGEELYNYIKDGMTYFINGTNKFMSLKSLDYGVLNIGSTTTISENYLMSYLKEFHNLYPNITINITNDLTDNLLKDLRNGNIDIVIGSKSFKENKDLKFNHLFDTEYIFVSNNNYDFSNKDILNEKLILQTSPSILRSAFDEYLKNNSLTANISMEVVSHKLVVEMVKSGLGIGLVVKEYVKNELDDKELYEINLEINMGKREVGYILKDNFIATYAVKEFIRIIKQ